jgi:hypothetical protein
MTSQATRLLDAQTVLVGWINHSATDCHEHIRSSGDVVNLGTDLDPPAPLCWWPPTAATTRP